jgi:hypothetical protein
VVKDSMVVMSDEFILPEDARFRNQELQVRVYIPYGKPFRMTPEFARYISNRFDSNELEGMPQSLWQFTTAGLNGVGFERTFNKDENRDDNDEDDDDEDDVNVDTNGELRRSLLPSSATATATPTTVAISGNFGVRFQKGSSLKVDGDGSEEGLNRVTITNEDGSLRIEQRDNNDGPRDRIGLTITLPTVAVLRLTGETEARLTEFDTLNALTVDLSGNSKAFVRTNARTITTEQTGASRIVLRGKADQVTATLSGASRASLGEVKNLSKKTSGVGRINQTNVRD